MPFHRFHSTIFFTNSTSGPNSSPSADRRTAMYRARWSLSAVSVPPPDQSRKRSGSILARYASAMIRAQRPFPFAKGWTQTSLWWKSVRWLPAARRCRSRASAGHRRGRCASRLRCANVLLGLPEDACPVPDLAEQALVDITRGIVGQDIEGALPSSVTTDTTPWSDDPAHPDERHADKLHDVGVARSPAPVRDEAPAGKR